MYLNTHSYYSLRYGIYSIEELVALAKRAGTDFLALTDINNTTGIPDFVKLCEENNITPIAGVDFRNGDSQLYTGIAINNEGFRELNEYISEHNLGKKEYPIIPPEFNNSYIIYPFGNREYSDLRENEFIGIKPAHVNKLFTSELKNKQNRLIIWQPVTFSTQQNFILHKNLRAIDHNTLLSKLTSKQVAPKDEVMIAQNELLKYYSEYPEIVKTTENLMSKCSIGLDLKTLKNKKTFTESKHDDKVLLEKLAMEGEEYRYGKNNPEAVERIRKELEIINNLGFSAYFLIAWDIIRYSQSRGFYHVGRGSGANSIVAYCLKITDVDPIELDLYFERFLNPKRTSPPDFDIDYSWKERDEVQDYIFKKYGREHTALLGAMSTFRYKAAYRELGKVYGLPKEEIDRLVHNPGDTINKGSITYLIHELAKQLEGFPNLRTIHAGGILISEEPITYYTALDLPPKGLPTTQWDMYVAENIGFEKLDILSQRGIGHIKEAAEIINKNRGIKVDVHNVKMFKEDEKVKTQLKTGETTGCFYIESPAMRGLLKKLKCNDYISLVAASSIIRPGVAKSGMMREYIQRFHSPQNISYIHPVMKEQLKETYGVMVYQEDVLKVAHHFAGLDLSDADILRRAMSGKFRSKDEFQKIKDKFFTNCNNKGYQPEVTAEVWRQIESFAGYSFSKAHSASYAVESFQSLYLKSHFPLEFMVAVINNFGGFYRSWVYFNEAHRWGGNIELPSVNHSTNTTTIIGNDIYIGFVHLQNLEHKTINKLIEEREQNGPFISLEDFQRRTHTTKEQLIILIRSGAFRFSGRSKSQLLWEAHMLAGSDKKSVSDPNLFELEPKTYNLPELETSLLEDAYDEFELLGFPVSIKSFDMLKTSFRGEVFAKDMYSHIGKKVRMLGRLVTIKYVRTKNNRIMNFGTFIDAKGEFFDTTHFPQSLKNYPFKGNGIYLLLGKIVEEFDFPSVEVEKMAKLPLKPDPRA